MRRDRVYPCPSQEADSHKGCPYDEDTKSRGGIVTLMVRFDSPSLSTVEGSEREGSLEFFATLRMRQKEFV